MRVAWFTPFNIESAIGRYSKFAAEALSKYADVDIFVFQKGNLHITSLNTISFDSTAVVQKLKEYDIVIYNIGDNPEYHVPIYNVAQLYSGIIINHDVCLHNLFKWYFLSFEDGFSVYKDMLSRMYGQEDAEMILDAAKDLGKWNLLDLSKYGMTELLGKCAYGIVCHSEYHRKILSAAYFGPVEVIHHLDTNELYTEEECDSLAGFDKGKLNILAVGNVNPNKRTLSMIQALGGDSFLKGCYNFVIIGSLDNKVYVNSLKQEINKFKLNKSVRLMGFVDHHDLALYYKNADIVCNLRYPAFEGGSGSLVEQMSLGKSIIATNTGVYAEIPDDCILKVNPDYEKEDLTRILQNIAKDRSIIKSYGKNAKAYAVATFSRELYGKKLYEFINRVIFTLPINDLAKKVRKELESLGASQTKEVIRNVAGEIENMFYQLNSPLSSKL